MLLKTGLRLDIGSTSELPLMNLRYNVFLGGVPEETRCQNKN
jgi:hypothetical protein